MSIHVTFGVGNSIEVPFHEGETWADVLAGDRVSVGLGLPNNPSQLAVRVNGIEVSQDSPAKDGDKASLSQKQAYSKA